MGKGYSPEQKEEIFNKFWDLYDKKITKPKVLAKWLKLNSDKIDAIMKHVPLYVKSTPNKRYRLHPSTYLNQESWNNEIIDHQEKKNSEKPNKEVQSKLGKYG